MSKPKRSNEVPLDDESLQFLQGTSHGNYSFTETTKKEKPSPRIEGFIKSKPKRTTRKK